MHSFSKRIIEGSGHHSSYLTFGGSDLPDQLSGPDIEQHAAELVIISTELHAPSCPQYYHSLFAHFVKHCTACRRCP